MKRLLILCSALLTGSLCFGQNYPFARWVAAETNWMYLAPTASTVQATFDWIDAHLGFSPTNWTLLPSNGDAQATFDFIDVEMSTNRVNMTNLFAAQGVINTNFMNLSNAFDSLQGTINTNADQSRTNALIANWNEGNISNLIGQALHNVYRSFTNIPGMSTNPAYTNVSSTNFGWSYSWKPEGTNFVDDTFNLALGFVDLASAFTGYSDGQTAPISNALASVQFDGAYISHYGWTPDPTNSTIWTNFIYDSTTAVTYPFIIPTNPAYVGSYASSSGPISIVKTNGGISGVSVSEPGRIQLNLKYVYSDMTPRNSNRSSTNEAPLLMTIRAYSNANGGATGWWRNVGAVQPPSAGWVPEGSLTNVVGYEHSLFYTDTFLVSGVSNTNAVDYRFEITRIPANTSVPANEHAVRLIQLTVLRTATWSQ